MSSVKRILIVDDHPILREGLAKLIEAQEGFGVCGVAGSAAEAVAAIESERPDLVLTDLTLPGKSGLELIKDLKVGHPELPVLVVSMHDEMVYAERTLKAGGRGYVMKEAPSSELLGAMRTVLEGGIHVSEAVTRHLLHTLSLGHGRGKTRFPLERLTDRELEVFELIGRGKGNGEIAQQLSISPRTVDAHRVHIREKLGLADGTALTRYAVRWNEAGMLGE